MFVKNASAMRSSLECLFSGRKSPAKGKSDAQIRQKKQDSEQQFSRLYHMHVQKLFNYGRHFCDDPEFVKRCLQEFFVRVREEHHLGIACSIRSYLFGSFRKLLIEKIHTRSFTIHVTNFPRTQFEFNPLSNEAVLADHGLSPFSDEQIIQVLTRRQAEVVFLKFNNRFSYHEVASIMDLNVSAVYSLVSGAVEICRRRMGNTRRKIANY
jgi:DNA-directed RNA polymerase specialized sigma24 family protein